MISSSTISFGSKLADDEYASFHLLRKQASSMDDCQTKEFEDIIHSQASIWKGKAIRVLSVGSGTGDFDSKIISSIFANRLAIEKYVCVEPIQENIKPLKTNLRKVLAEDQFEVIESLFEDNEFPVSFDFIHNVHVIHWMKNPVNALKKMDQLLVQNGLVVSVLQSEKGLPRLYGRFKQSSEGILTAERLIQMAKVESLSYHINYVTTHLDVTSIVNKEELGRKILQFVISRKLDESQYEESIPYIKDLAKKDNGKYLIEEPFAFIINHHST